MGSMRVWYCGDVMTVVGVQISCEIGCVFPIEKYEDGQGWGVVLIRVGTVYGLFQCGREFIRVKLWEGHGRTRPCCVFERF